MSYIPLDNLDYNNREEEGDKGTEETNVDEETNVGEWGYLLDGWNSLNEDDRLGITIDHSDVVLNRVFGKRVNDARNLGFFMVEVIEKPLEYSGSKFIKYILEKHNLTIRKTLSGSGLITNYEIEFYRESEYRVYVTINGELSSEDYYECSKDMDYLFDKWKDSVLKQKIKKAGLLGGIGLAITGLISGLSLGLKRSGHGIVHDSKVKKEKLTPAERNKEIIPWADIEEAGGKAVIMIGNYLFYIIGGTIFYYVVRE